MMTKKNGCWSFIIVHTNHFLQFNWRSKASSKMECILSECKFGVWRGSYSYCHWTFRVKTKISRIHWFQLWFVMEHVTLMFESSALLFIAYHSLNVKTESYSKITIERKEIEWNEIYATLIILFGSLVVLFDRNRMKLIKSRRRLKIVKTVMCISVSMLNLKSMFR